MTLSEFRQKYPQYNNLSDAVLTRDLYNKFYSNRLTFSEFSKKFGYMGTPTINPVPAPKPLVTADSGPTQMAHSAGVVGDTVGGADYLLHLGSSLVTGVIGPLAKTGRDILHAVTGEPMATPEQDTALGNAITYSPHSEVGKAIEGHVDNFLSKISANAAVQRVAGSLGYLESEYGKAAHGLESGLGEVTGGIGELGNALGLRYKGKPLDTQGAGENIGKAMADVAPLVLYSDNPLTRGVGEFSDVVTNAGANAIKPVTAAVRDALHDKFPVVSSTEELQRAGEVQAEIYRYQGLQSALNDKYTKFLKAADKAGFNDEQRMHIENYALDDTLTYPLPDELKGFVIDHFDPLRQEAGMEPGYLPRISLDHPNPASALLKGKDRPSVIKILSTFNPATIARTWFKAVPKEGGEPLMIHLDDVGAVPERFTDASGVPAPVYGATPKHAYKVFGVDSEGKEIGLGVQKMRVEPGRQAGGTEFTHKGKTYAIHEARRSELEGFTAKGKHPLHFLDDPILSVAHGWMAKMQSELARGTLDNLNKIGEGFFKEFAAGDEPAEWEQIKNVHFRGAQGKAIYAPKPLANVVNGLVGEKTALQRFLRGSQHVLLRLAFIVPVWHDLNVVTLHLEEKAGRLLNPSSWTHYAQAAREVTNNSGDYLKIVQSGRPMWKPMLSRDTARTMERSYVAGLREPEAQTWLEHIGVPAPVRALVSGAGNMGHWWVQHIEHSTMYVNDILVMSAVKERMALRGLDAVKAADEVFKYMPTYRISNVGAVNHALNVSRNIFWFMPYHVDRMRVLWNQVKGTARGNPENAAMLLAHALIVGHFYPQLDAAAQYLTGNPRAHVERFGSDRIVADLADIANLEQPAGKLVGDLFTLTPVIAAPFDISEEGYEQPTKKWGNQKIYPTVGSQLEAISGELPGVFNYPLKAFTTGNEDTERRLLNMALDQIGVIQPALPKPRAAMEKGGGSIPGVPELPTLPSPPSVPNP